MDAGERIEIIRELCSFEGRLAGTDAERRAANRLAERLREAGRRVEVEPTYVHPQFGLIYAAHCAIAVAGSLAPVAAPVVGFALVFFAATSMYLDLNARFYLLRRLLFRRASQNVVSRGVNPNAPARLLLVAHLDAARTGTVYGPKRMRLLARVAAAMPFPFSPSRLIFWSAAILVPLVGAQAAGLDSQGLSVLQLLPTLVLLVAVFAFIDIELSDVVPGANDNASGVATALSLASELESDRPANLDVWVVLTGGQESLSEGMRAFVRGRRKTLDASSTYVINLEGVGRGDLRFEVGEGPAVTFEMRSRLTQLAEAIATADAAGEDRFGARPMVQPFATDALPARLHGCATTTLTCIERGAAVPANYHLPTDTPDAIDPEALDRAHAFALELIQRLDRDLGRTRQGPVEIVA